MGVVVEVDMVRNIDIGRYRVVKIFIKKVGIISLDPQNNPER